MQRIASLAAAPGIGGLAARGPAVRAWKKGPAGRGQPLVHGQWAGACARAFAGEPGAPGRGFCRGFCRRRLVFVGQTHRLVCSRPGADGPAGSSGGQPALSVVGSPDPITWIRCKAMMYLISVCFESDVTSVEFERGVKQAVLHVSNVMSSGNYHELKGVVSNEMVKYIQKRCRPLTKAQRRQLALTMDDIIFVFPEDVSVVFDQYGRKFCFIVLRFWLLSTHEGPDDPEGMKIFKVPSSEDGSPQKKIATAVYEFHQELTRGASPDWTVTTVWHWHWTLAK
ncbi:Hypothetical protein SMAX5B_018111 [Scophthalmus maximus]|uniref:Si:dkey-82o10.4 n=3 Tax=Scophthalmus maximus TaxID=52904 RepID=A0A2U9CGD7_SCOMX|nr:Hypothetical protein SMAX5B_018111 [Scophthalmus maximus]